MIMCGLLSFNIRTNKFKFLADGGRDVFYNKNPNTSALQNNDIW